MGKGSRAERELINKFWESGFATMRSPASGSGRKHPQPDLLTSIDGNVYGIEIKSSSEDTIYIDKEEIKKLKNFCNSFGCEPLIGVRFDWVGWAFFRPENCETTSKNYKISKESVDLKFVEGEGFRKQETIS